MAARTSENHEKGLKRQNPRERQKGTEKGKEQKKREEEGEVPEPGTKKEKRGKRKWRSTWWIFTVNGEEEDNGVLLQTK